MISGDIHFIAPDGSNKAMKDYADEQKAEFSKVDKDVKNLQDQIDGVVENHFYQGEPSLTSLPTSLWTTDEQKINHIGDTYTDIEEFVDSVTTPNAGKSWRWCRCDDMVGIEDYVEVTDKDGEVYKLHWHPIADTDAVKALLKVYELEKRVDDAEYLKDIFEQGSTEVNGGVVMSNMVAVRDSESDGIKAFLNGSADFKHPEKKWGKMILASGIPDTTASGSTDLKERANEAATKLFENGVLESDYVFFDAGFVGTFFGDSTKFKANSTYSDKDESMLVLSMASPKENVPSGLGFRNISSSDGVDTQVSFASRSHTGPSYDKLNSNREKVGTMDIPFVHGLGSKIESTGSQKYEYLSALTVSCKGTSAKENFAIRSEAGMFAGLRPRLVRNPKNTGYTNEYTFSKLDHTIVFEDGDSGDFYFHLPDNPEVGQHYEIIRWKASRGCHFDDPNRNIAIYRVDTQAYDYSFGIGHGWGGKIEFTYDGLQWIMLLIGGY